MTGSEFSKFHLQDPASAEVISSRGLKRFCDESDTLQFVVDDRCGYVCVAEDFECENDTLGDEREDTVEDECAVSQTTH
jgi:hypothetical protein